jgi:energy-coupling factor transporter transmembrane protein EcfT
MLHPAARLLVWGAAAVAVQVLQDLSLYLVAAASVGLAALSSAARLWRLLRRTRWLLLAIALLFGFGTPGVLLMPELGTFSPTWDGLHLAATRLARLVAVLASLALLLEHTSAASLVGALHGLLAPAARIGLDRGRIAVRLMLVLQYAESARAGAWREWLEPGAPQAPQRIVLTRTPWRRRDGVTIAVALLAIAGLLAG